jgi:hypothetical protein
MTDEKVFPEVANVPYRGDDELSERCHRAFEAQLAATGNAIHNVLTTHAHFTDDCGEYLRNSLEASYRLQSAREEGVESLVEYMKKWATVGMESEAGYDYATIEMDDMADELFEVMRELGYKTYEDREGEEDGEADSNASPSSNDGDPGEGTPRED